jgi:hypothetical protein
VSESSERYIKLLKTNLDKVTIGVLGMMMVGMGGALFLEKSSDFSASQPESEILKLEDPLAANPNWKLVQAMATRQEMVQYPAIRQIRQYNMFDYKSVKDREVLERAANQKYDQAERLRKEGKTVEARKLAEEVLGSIPTHRRAKELLDQLTAPAPAPGTAPAAAPPGAPPAAAAPAAPPGQPAR